MTLLPMIGMIGLGIDVARTMTARTALQGAADAGALAAATEAEAVLLNGDNSLPRSMPVSSQAAGIYANVGKISRWMVSTRYHSVSKSRISEHNCVRIVFDSASDDIRQNVWR